MGERVQKIQVFRGETGRRSNPVKDVRAHGRAKILMAKRRYGLYIVRPEDIGEKERYFLITPEWTLLYTNRKPPERHKEITDLSQLPSLAMEWLNATIEQMRAEYLEGNAREILQRGKVFNERFAEELQAEQEKLKGEKGEND